MTRDELKKIARDYGVVGAGGAGFPTYAKMSEKADVIILNCVECEPLLKLHRQLLACHTEEILGMMEDLRSVFGAKEAVIGIKNEYKTTIAAIKKALPSYSNMRLCEVKAAYPMGDEVVLIYEATGRVIRAGGLPIEENVVVINVETMYNLYRAVHLNIPVVDKLISIVGEIDNPVTLRVPIGITVKEAVSLAGNITTSDPVFLMGGPMMGFMGDENTVITKTSNAIIILPANHKLILSMDKNLGIEKRRASSSCCQCRTCTDMCPRHELGHPIEPHRVMRAVANQDSTDLKAFLGTAYCSGCGVCEKFACPQSLSPKTIMQAFKQGLRAGNIKVSPAEPAPVEKERDYRQVPVHRLAVRLGLGCYDVKAPLEDETVSAGSVNIKLSQHIGAPAIPIVKVGDRVVKGQMIAKPAEGLSVGIHASLDGEAVLVTEKEIVIKRGTP